MKRIINKIKAFFNRYNPREITRLLKCIEKEIYNINKVIGIIRNREVKERNEVLKVYIDGLFDELDNKIIVLEKDIITRGQLKEHISMGVSVDNIVLDNKIKALKEEIISLNTWCNSNEKDIKVNKISIVNNYEEHKSLQNVHNNLASDYNTYKLKYNRSIK